MMDRRCNLFRGYFILGFTYVKITYVLVKTQGIILSVRHLKRILLRYAYLSLFRRKKTVKSTLSSTLLETNTDCQKRDMVIGGCIKNASSLVWL